MKAFHGDEAVKQKYLARLKAHHAADEIIQGQGWDGSHGCAVGCTLNRYDHKAYENELGLPQWLAHLEDKIFENLPAVKAQQFAVDFLEAVPVGADVENVRCKLASQRHTRDRDRLSANSEPYAVQCVAALDLVIAYCDSEMKTESAARSARSAARSAWSAAWSAARSAAESAAESARSAAESAESAAWAAAESAAWATAWATAAESARSARSAAESAAESARSAAWSAESESARSAAESAAWSAESAYHFKWEAATLLELLRNAPQAAE